MFLASLSAVVRSSVSSQAVVHAQGAFKLLRDSLVKGDLLLEVGLHHIFEVHLSTLMEVAHLGLQRKAHCPAAFPDAVRLTLVHLPLVTHPLALLHLRKGTWVKTKRDTFTNELNQRRYYQVL